MDIEPSFEVPVPSPDALPALVWVQLQRQRPDGPLVAMNVTDEPSRAEDWQRTGREVRRYRLVADDPRA